MGDMEEEFSKGTHLLHLTHPELQSLSRVHLACASLLQSARTESVRGAKFAAGYFQQRAVGCDEAFHNMFPLPPTFFFSFIPEAPIVSAA